jgi:sugar-specific transcriptional regulator TrmB
VRFGRSRRFADLIARQLELFEEEHETLIRECEEAERAYDRAERGEGEEAWGDYRDLVETATDALEELRDTYGRTLDEEAREEYDAAFERAVAKRFPRFRL